MLLIENIYNTEQHKICNIVSLQVFMTILVYKIQLQYKRKKKETNLLLRILQNLYWDMEGWLSITKKKKKKLRKNKIALFKYIYQCSYVHLSRNAFIDQYIFKPDFLFSVLINIHQNYALCNFRSTE